jgi:hypothetical protein
MEEDKATKEGSSNGNTFYQEISVAQVSRPSGLKEREKEMTEWKNLSSRKRRERGGKPSTKKKRWSTLSLVEAWAHLERFRR